MVAAKLLNPATHDAYVADLKQEYQALRETMEEQQAELVSLQEARNQSIQLDWSAYQPVVPHQLGVHVLPSIPLQEIIPYIHWTFFFQAWKLTGRFDEISRIHGCDSCRAMWLAGFPEKDRAKAAEAMQLFKDAQRLLLQMDFSRQYVKVMIFGFRIFGYRHYGNR